MILKQPYKESICGWRHCWMLAVQTYLFCKLFSRAFLLCWCCASRMRKCLLSTSRALGDIECWVAPWLNSKALMFEGTTDAFSFHPSLHYSYPWSGSSLFLTISWRQILQGNKDLIEKKCQNPLGNCSATDFSWVILEPTVLKPHHQTRKRFLSFS